MSYASSFPRQRQPHLHSSSSSSSSDTSPSFTSRSLPKNDQPTYTQYSHHKPHQSSLSKRIRSIIVLFFLISLICGVSYLVYKFGGPKEVYRMGDEFVHFPDVTTPVDPIEALTKGAVSVATQIAGAVTQAAGQVADGAKDAANQVGDGAKDAADKIKGAFGGIGRERY